MLDCGFQPASTINSLQSAIVSDSTMSIFNSEHAFWDAYQRKLALLLREEENAPDFGLGAFVLVCANAYFNSKVLSALKPDLQQSFERLRATCADFLTQGRLFNDRYAEDLPVFLKMALVGLEKLQVTEHRQVGPWNVQFNHLRSFRPQRAAAHPVASIDLPFSDRLFYYHTRILERENFWCGELNGKNACLLYNKYPFARLHSLLLLEPERKLRQFLDAEMLAWAWETVRSLSARLPGFGLGYNSLGTFASVNHLHFQTFIEPQGLPVTSSHWTHNGGAEEYPLPCRVFGDPASAWGWMEEIHRRDKTSYNLLITAEKIYGFERRRQGTYTHSKWTSGFAWFEVTGNMLTFSKDDFQNFSAEQVIREFEKIRINEPTQVG
jgi:hypothetical protein